MTPKEKLKQVQQKMGVDIDALDRRKEEFEPIKANDLISMEFEPVQWILGDLVPAEAMTALSGDPASMKTWLMLDIAIAVASGKAWLDRFPTIQKPCLIIDEENGPRELKKRLCMLGLWEPIPLEIISYKNFMLNETDIEAMLSHCHEKKIELVLIDSLVRINTANENDANQMAQVLNLLKRFTKEGIAVLFLHHNRKRSNLERNVDVASSMRGSSDILAAVDCHIGVKRKQDNDTLSIYQSKLRQAQEHAPFQLHIKTEKDSLSFQYGGDVEEISSKKDTAKAAIQILLKSSEKHLNKSEIVRQVSQSTAIGTTTIKQVLKEMELNQEVETLPGKRYNEKFYAPTN